MNTAKKLLCGFVAICSIFMILAGCDFQRTPDIPPSLNQITGSILDHQLSLFFPFVCENGMRGGVDSSFYYFRVQLSFPRNFSNGYSSSIFPPPPTNSRHMRIILGFERGNVFIRERYNNLGVGDEWTFPQNIFWNAACTNWGNINDDSQYIAWIGFDEPINREQLLDKFPTLFACNAENMLPWETFGVSWLALKTDDDPNAIALGMAGSLQVGRDHDSREIARNLHLWEQDFVSSLNFLIEHREASDLILSSGLFESAETVDFSERLGYVHENGFYYLGFVAHIRGYDLRNLYDTGVNLVRLIEDN